MCWAKWTSSVVDGLSGGGLPAWLKMVVKLILCK